MASAQVGKHWPAPDFRAGGYHQLFLFRSIAAKERLRPILMTSFAFIVGTLPLALATGAGSAAHIAIGTAVVGGMTGATVLAVLFVPKFFVSVLTLFRVQRNAPDKPPVSTAEEGGAH